MDISTHLAKSTDRFDFSELIGQCDLMMKQYWGNNPDLYQIVQQKKQEAELISLKERTNDGDSEVTKQTSLSTGTEIDTHTTSIFSRPLRGASLRAKIHESHHEIRKHVLSVNADIIPRTQAQNRKAPYQTIEGEQAFRAEVLAAQIRSWRSMLPKLIRQFSKIPDYRRATSVNHKLTVLMIVGLFAFIFRLSSRREMNRDLTRPIVLNHLKNFFLKWIAFRMQIP